MLTRSPYILYSDGKGNIFEDTSLYATGRSGWDALPVPEEDWIELPDGGSLYELPGRKGIGINPILAERVKSAERLRDALVKTLERIHALLNPEQRARFAYLIRTGTLSL